MKFWELIPDGVELSDEPKWVQILSAGSFKHPLHGTISLTQDRFQRFVDNFKSKVRGTDLDVDYDHKMDPSKGRKASGWIRDLQARSDGLWGLVEWTEDAKEAIKKREYRYISADFFDKWTDQSGKEHHDVLAGAALTNRPFLKDMVPVNFTELTDTKEESMDPKLRKALIGKYKLSDDATDEQIQAAVEGSNETVDVSKASVTFSEDGKGKVSIPGVEGEIQFEVPPPAQGDEDDDLKKLAEDHPQIAKMLSDREEDRKRLARLESASRLTEITTQLNEVDGLPPVVLTELRETLVAAPKEFSDKIVSALGTLRKQGFVPVKGQGSVPSRRGSEDGAAGGDAIKRFMDACDAEKAKDENKSLSETDIYLKVAAEQPNLYYEYEKATLNVGEQFAIPEEVE